MPIDASSIADLKRSFAAATKSNAFAETFYRRLFAVDPDLQAPFNHVDMRAQGAMIEQAVGLVLEHLDNMEAALPIIEGLGYRHKNYGVAPEHYQSAASALVETLEALAGPEMDERNRSAWVTVLGKLATIMIEGGERLFNARRERIQGFAQADANPAYVDPYVMKFLPAQPVAPQFDTVAAGKMDLPRLVNIDFAGDKEVQAAPLQTVLDIALQHDIPHHYICGGTGRCSTCHVSVIDGLENCLPRNQLEAMMAEMKGFPPDLRLACQTRVVGPVRLRRLVRDPKDVLDSVEFAREQAGREMDLAIMFVDIIDFTSFSEKNLPYDIVHALNRFFDATGTVIDRYDGYIDEYLGDGVMAIFGLKQNGETNACESAISAALRIIGELDRINRYLDQHLGQTFKVGMGIDYGPVVVGNIDSRLRRQFTALGDVVNVAARLEIEAKRRGISLLVSKAVRDRAGAGAFVFGDELRLAIRGKASDQWAYAVQSAV